MQYRWKNGSRIGGDAQAVGEYLDSMERDGRLTAAQLVEDNEDEGAPLHGYFEWDDEVAAHRFRIVQAAEIIRSIEVVVVGDSGEKSNVRAFVSAREVDDEPRRYVGIARCVESPTLRACMLADAKRDMDAFTRKYSKFAELAGVIAAMDGAKAAIEVAV